MTEQNDGGPAFPWREEDGEGGYNQHVGMSLRDWFAGNALAGNLAADTSHQWGAPLHARWAYEQADAMIAARKAKM